MNLLWGGLAAVVTVIITAVVLHLWRLLDKWLNVVVAWIAARLRRYHPAKTTDGATKPPEAPERRITDRQRVILYMTRQGSTEKAIAQAVNVGERTIQREKQELRELGLL